MVDEGLDRQEAVAAHQIWLLCGFEVVDADILFWILQGDVDARDVESRLFTVAHPHIYHAYRLAAFRWAWIRERCDPGNAVQILQMHRGRSASKEVDKVYSLYGLIYSFEDRGVAHADCFTGVWSWAYIAATRKIIKTTARLDILSLTESSQYCDHLPNWVPDWRTELNVSVINARCISAANRGLSSSRDTTARTITPAPEKLLYEILEAEGPVWTKVETVCPCVKTRSPATDVNQFSLELLARHSDQMV
jgi:hypothetical protein